MSRRTVLSRTIRGAISTVIAFGLVLSGTSLAANAAIVSEHEITANWAAPVPASVLYANSAIAEWHISTNDASQPETNEDVANVTATLTAENGRFAEIPAVCKTTGVTPASSRSADGVTLICNLGVVKAGTVTVLQTAIRATSSTGGSLSASGTVTSDTAAAPAGPATVPGLPITYNYGMDLIIATPSSNPAEGGQRSVYLEGNQERERMIVDWAIAANDGSRPGPVNYDFRVDISSTTPGAVLGGITPEGCSSIDTEITVGMPFSVPTRPDRSFFPGCTVERISATSYIVRLTGIDYSLTNVPVRDSTGALLPASRNYIAAGALTFSNPYPIDITTEFRYSITPLRPWTYPGTAVTTVDPVANNLDTVILYAPGNFSNRWAGTPTAGRSVWDDQLFVSAGVGSTWTLPSPTGGASGQPLPLYMQANSNAWREYTGPGGTNMAGVCTMNQTATSLPAPESNNFVFRYMDAGGWEPVVGYTQMSTAQYWYTTANIDTKTFACNTGTWTRIVPPAGTTFKDPRVTGSNVMTLPANVTAIRMTWNPGVDRVFGVIIRGFGYIKSNAVPSTTSVIGEGWTVGAFNAPTATGPVWYNQSQVAGTHTATPWSRYATGTNGYRDVFRIVGNTGRLTKVANPKEAGPGIPVTYTLNAQTVSTTTPPANGNFTVVDTLPPGMTYIAGSARIDGNPITPASAIVSGRQRLTFTVTNSPANVNRVITYQAMLPANSTVAPGTTLTNSAVINVPGDNREVADRTATASVVVPNAGTTNFGKTSGATYVPYAGGSSYWDLTLRSLDPVVNAYTDTIDILPYKGDENGTDIDGGYRVNTVTFPAGTWRIYYTTAAPGGLSDDPRNPMNGTAPGAITGNTVGWTAITVTGGSATIPATATALRILGPALNPGAQQIVRMNFSTVPPTSTDCAAPGATDNKPGQLIVNAATSYAGHTRLPMLSSATTTIADCNQIEIKKYVLAKGTDPSVATNWHDAQDASDFQQYAQGDTAPFRITVTNRGTGPLTNIVVTDPLYTQCAFTIATLAAGASQSRDCVGNAAPLGTTENIAHVSVQPPVGAVLTGQDPASIVVPLPPQIVKTADPATGSTVEPGETITYSVTITEPETSPAPYGNPSFSDVLTDVLDDADLVPNSITVTSDPVVPNAGTASITGTTLNWSAPMISPGQSITVSYQVTVKNPDTGNKLLRNVVTPKTGIECVTCTTEHLVPGIHFEKTADVTVAHPGQTVTYTVNVQNTGQVPYTAAYPATATDPLTGVLDDADVVPGSLTNGAVFDGDSVDWTGELAVGATTSFSFQVIVKNPNPGDNQLRNRITSPTPGSNCPEDSTDPDCDVTVPVQSYTVEKTTAEEPVIRGDVVFYSITIRNTGEVPYTGVGADVASFDDDLADVLDDASFNSVSGGAVFAGGHLTWAGELGVGASKTFTYSVTVLQTPNPASLVLNNVVVPTGPGGTCAAAGACDTSTPIAQFHVAKSASPAYTNPGGTVHYTIVVQNTGQVAFTDAFPASFADSFSDIVDDGEIDAEFDDDGNIVSGSITTTAGVVTYQGSTLRWVGPIALGGTVTIEYDVLVDNPDRGNHRLVNTITTPPGLANCDTGSTDPDCGTNTPIQSYELVKTADSTVAEVGDTVNYTLTVTNTGEVDYPAGPGEPQASISDDVSDVLNNADFGGTVTASSGTASFDPVTERINWVGDLPVGGAPVTITYSVTIHTAVSPPDRLVNRATTTTVGGNCDPLVDIDLADPRCHLSIPTRSYEVVKSVSQTVVEPGTNNLTYTITVTNTGSEAYTGTTIGDESAAEIEDSLADILADASNPVLVSQPAGWDVEFDANPASATYGQFVAAGPLAVAQTVTFVYTVDINDPDVGDHRLENRVTTPPGRGGNCTELSTDPDCDATVLVREFTVEKSVTPEITQIGDTVVYTILIKNTGAVAYDGLTPETSAGMHDDLSDVLDDAAFGSILVGPATFDGDSVDWSGALPIGGTVTVVYSVIANGNDEHVLINGVEPEGPGGKCATADGCETEVLIRSYEYEKSASPASTVEGGVVTYTVTIRNTGAVAYTDASPAGFTDDLSGVFDDAGDLSSITVTPDVGTAEINGSVLSWSGPLGLPGSAGDEVTVSYSVTVNEPDTGDHHLLNAVTHTPGTGGECTAPGDCDTDTPVRSYLVQKSSSPATTLPGGIVGYTITVTNTGAVAYTDADPASLRDDISDVLDVTEAPTDLAVSGASDNAPTFDAAAEEILWSGELPVGGVVTLTYQVQVRQPVPAGADFLLENVVEPTGPGGSCGDCETVTPIQAYTTVKRANMTEAQPGDTVTYTVTVTNVGQVAYEDPRFATFSDNLADVLDDATGPTGITGGATFDPGTQTLSWSGELAIGEVATITYSVLVSDPAVTDGDGVLDNAVLTPPDGGCVDPASPDCTETTLVRSLHYVKTVSTPQAHPGDVIEYTITVENNGTVDYTAGDPAIFDDALAAVLDDVEDVTEESLDLEASIGTATYDTVARSIHWEGPLAAGETATVTYRVQILKPNLGDNVLSNRVVSPPGFPSNCPEESTDPDCAVETLVRSFHIEKSADRTEFFPGDVVVYTITLENTGAVDYTDASPVSWTDPLTDVLDDAAFTAVLSGGAVWDGVDTLSWSGPLAVGETRTFTYSVTVDNPIAGDRSLYNRVSNPPDIGGNCDPDSEDPLCEVEIGGPSVHIAKTSSTAEAYPGDTVLYTIVITNNGGIDWTEERPAQLDDDLSDVLDDATYNNDATNGAVVTGDELTWSGPLPRGESVTIRYSVTVNKPVTGDGIMDNVVTTPPEVPSNCTAPSSDPDCVTRTLVRSYLAIKTSSAAGIVKPGDRVTYTVTVVNNGQLPYTEESPAFFEDDFSGVLDDATYLDDANGETSYVAPKLLWEGPLDIGERVTVTYTFVIKAQGGDNRLVNAVLTTLGIGGSCNTVTDPGCSTTVNIERPLAFTGSSIVGPLLGMLVLLGLGGLLYGFSRRRKATLQLTR